MEVQGHCRVAEPAAHSAGWVTSLAPWLVSPHTLSIQSHLSSQRSCDTDLRGNRGTDNEITFLWGGNSHGSQAGCTPFSIPESLPLNSDQLSLQHRPLNLAVRGICILRTVWVKGNYRQSSLLKYIFLLGLLRKQTKGLSCAFGLTWIYQCTMAAGGKRGQGLKLSQ